MKSRWIEMDAGGIRIPLLGLAAAVLAVVTLAGVMGYRNWDLAARNDDLGASLADARRKEADCVAAIQAGTDFLLAANNFDYRKPEEWTTRMAALTTGPVHDYFATDKVAQDNSALITAGKLRKTSTVADAACALQTATGVRVIAQLDESTQNFQVSDPVKTTSAVWAELGKVDGAWKVIDSGRGDQALKGDLTAAQPAGPTATTPAEQPR
ncbi:hypothetical protein [Nocardia yamanashiensis]|uniref:hypothetical protein n=1 Tax=Nocardia yamanashiensis TaxID=209247 RepID=UPI0012F8C711|nr:hypothetical protein [Nocardia yamanashiensis]